MRMGFDVLCRLNLNLEKPAHYYCAIWGNEDQYNLLVNHVRNELGGLK